MVFEYLMIGCFSNSQPHIIYTIQFVKNTKFQQILGIDANDDWFLLNFDPDIFPKGYILTSEI